MRSTRHEVMGARSAPSTYPFPRYSCQFSVVSSQSEALLPVSDKRRLPTENCSRG